ncbi:gluconate 2-dehydrogenase gamma chain [Robbsia andropogonis]|uniref:gluconate 2-dehydrogenase subunit 3 family protein n=1 Tax=Robbsia andropogonis TaxID=28092 RepID=UPI003D236A3F
MSDKNVSNDALRATTADVSDGAPVSANRRRFLRGSAAVIPVIPVAGASAPLIKSAFAEAPPAAPLDQYQPTFFNQVEWAFIKAATDRLIPANSDGPGALETNVPVFIDRELASGYGAAEDWYMEGPFDVNADPLFGYQLPYSPREMYRIGIGATQKYCQQQYQKSFEALDEKTRDDVLTALEKNNVDFKAFGEQQLRAAQFFSALLGNTQEGYLSDPIHGGNRDMGSWKMMGFPGARASYTEWIDQHNVPYPLGPVDLAGRRG